MTSALSWYRPTRLWARALAGPSALLGMLMVASTSAPVVAQLMGHFGISYGDSLWVIALVSAGSIVLFWVFPYLVPFIGTIRLLMLYFGTAAVVGW